MMIIPRLAQVGLNSSVLSTDLYQNGHNIDFDLMQY